MRQNTREHALWLVIALSAGVLRFVALNLPLSDSEARFALESLNAARGQTAVLVNPLSGGLQSLALALFGDSSAVARTVATAAGTLMCLLPALLRRTIGRERALALAVLLTISPTLMFVSRQASGEALAWMLAVRARWFAGCRARIVAGLWHRRTLSTYDGTVGALSACRFAVYSG
jgi:predicted membrane-bound mannosyltransferase